MTPSHPSPLGNEPIAIIGSGCRFPGGASSPSKLWELLRDPRDVLQEIPKSRFDIEGFYHKNPQHHGHANVRHSYLLSEDISQFDAQFFNVKGVEASAMDPQHRILLETVYEGLESAGLTIEALKGSDTGVYCGLMYGDYEVIQLRDLQSLPTYSETGNARSLVSNRISYFFDWHGPSMTIDTACSSSLVALHQAVQTLRAGDSQVALAAGSNLLLGPEHYVGESKLNMLSPDGRSRMWDQDANGYARGDGVAVLVLKTLSAALAAGDHIQCLIRETGVNQDGRTRGISMPSASAQAALISATYKKAGLNPRVAADRCQYFEAHGTGTPAGDPIEAEAVQTAFFGNIHDTNDDRSKSQKEHVEDQDKQDKKMDELLVGSIKTVIGHTESTAGLAGILKAILAMENGLIPPNLHFSHLNPDILPYYDHLKIPETLTPWPEVPPGQPRRASVNSFGFGGTNAHVILETLELTSTVVVEDVEMNEATEMTEEKLDESPRACSRLPFLFSAYSKQALFASIATHSKFLSENPTTSAANLAWTLRARRSRLPFRISFPASSIEELQDSLAEVTVTGIDGLQLQRSASGQNTRILGVFTGQGAQYARMGAQLISSPFVAKILNGFDARLKKLPQDDRPSWSFREQLLAEASSSRLADAAISQPLCTAIQIVLVELLRLAGIELAAVVGHSSGEIAAAFAAGHLSMNDAMVIAYYRGLHTKLVTETSGIRGAMLAVGTSWEDAQELCNMEEYVGRVVVAACNSPSSVTLSGDEDAIAEMELLLKDEKKFYRRIKVDMAYHSHHMRVCSKAYLDSIRNCSIQVQKPNQGCVWVSSVYPDQPLDAISNLDNSYWDDNMISPVLFMQAIERAMTLGSFSLAIEVGPHPALKGPVRETLQQHLQTDIAYTGLLQRNACALRSISNALGYLWVQLDSLAINFDKYEGAMGGPSSFRFIPNLPLYQWQHDRMYWQESRISRSFRQRRHPVHPLLGDLSPDSSPHQLMFRNLLRLQELPWINGHQIQGQVVFPAAGYVVTALETASFLAGESFVQLVELNDFIIHQAVVFDNEDQQGTEVMFIVNNINRNNPRSITAQFSYSSSNVNQDKFQLVASGEIIIVIGEPEARILPAGTKTEPNMVTLQTETFYSALRELGYGYSDSFQGLSELKSKLGKASGRVTVTPVDPDEETLIVHPAMLDCALQSVLLAKSFPLDGELWSLHVPTKFQRIRVNPALCGRHWIDVESVSITASLLNDDGGPGFRGDIEFHTSNGEYAAIQMEGVRVVPFANASSADDQQMFYAMRWVNAEPDAETVVTSRATAEDYELAYILERGACFYLRHLEEQIPPSHPGRSDSLNHAYLHYASYINRLVAEEKHHYMKKDWLNDKLEDILDAGERYVL